MKRIDQSYSAFFCSVRVVLVSLLGTLIVCLVSLAHAAAEVVVSGSKAAMTVEARNSNLDEVVSAIGKLAKIKIDLALTSNPPIGGRYTGSLRYVLSRILLGQNYVIRQTGDQISIVAWTGSAPAPSKLVSSSAPPMPAIAEPPVQGWRGGFSVKPAK